MDSTLKMFRAGQVWKYDNRPGEDDSTVTILKAEEYDKGDPIVHIRVDGIRLYNPGSKSGGSTFIAHMPFSEKAISSSVTELIGRREPMPDFSEGYNQWKKEWESGKAGYWNISLKEAINGMDVMMQENGQKGD